MTNAELMQSMQQAGRLTIVSAGDAKKPTRYPQDAPGSPQTVVTLKLRDGSLYNTFVVLGIDGTTFRIVLDDKHRKIRKGESLRSAVRRFLRAQTERIWPKAEYPGYEIV